MGCASSSSGSAVREKDTGETWRSDEVEPGREQPVDEDDHDKPYDDAALNLGVTLNIEEIRDAVIQSGRLFEDDEFPADESSLFFSNVNHDDTVWKRPHELTESPRLLVDGVSRDDVIQGILGDCWFLSSCAAIAQHKRFMEKVIPTNQFLWKDNSYIGMFHFKFWRFGKWVDVVIDDRLPTRYGQLMFARANDEREFWVPLLEKAYAKLHGLYEGLAGGQASDALVDMTGGLTERHDLQDPPTNLYQQLVRNARLGSFITCSKKGDWRQADHADDFGLVSGHAYTITAVRKCRLSSGSKVNLVRVRNPWGNATEWNGDWSDDSETWDDVSDKEKRSIGWKDKDDGEFWMSFEDFCTHFHEITVCTVGPDFDGDGVADIVENSGSSYYLKTLKGSWIKGLNAGGSRNNLTSFATNPQFVFTLTEPDDWDPEEDDLDSRGKCSVVITLMQEYRRKHRQLATKYHQIGFVIYSTNNPNKRLTKDHFMYNYATGRSGVYINYREVNKRFSLDPGSYVLIPSTFDIGNVASFLIRIFAEKNFECRQLPDA
ncbi:calpain clp-1-like [Ptychodera flava]|uniref:calpain clp-1-like n=1 Tax=Ptychodera flava TaxID=63121 RepID=UPI003969F96E